MPRSVLSCCPRSCLHQADRNVELQCASQELFSKETGQPEGRFRRRSESPAGQSDRQSNRGWMLHVNVIRTPRADRAKLHSVIQTSSDLRTDGHKSLLVIQAQSIKSTCRMPQLPAIRSLTATSEFGRSEIVAIPAPEDAVRQHTPVHHSAEQLNQGQRNIWGPRPKQRRKSPSIRTGPRHHL